MDNFNTNYKYIVTLFVLNTLLRHVGVSCIFETNEQLKYDMDKNNPYRMTVVPWYNTYICKKYMEYCLNNLL